jgi:hypothetical protein
LKTRLRPNGSAKMVGGKPFSRGHLYRILSSPIYTGRIEHKGQTYAGQHPPIIDLAAAYDTDERYAASVLRLAFLSPDLTRHILDGIQQPDLTQHSMLKEADLPIRWLPSSASC